MEFVWDEKKNKDNIKAHKVSFLEAETAFYDANAKIIHDPDHSSEEDRFIIMGLSELLNLLVVCHCYREEAEVIRIISARKATKMETNVMTLIKQWIKMFKFEPCIIGGKPPVDFVCGFIA